jgi:hypothetical protein
LQGYDVPVLFLGADHLGSPYAEIVIDEAEWRHLAQLFDKRDLDLVRKASKQGVARFLKEARVGRYYLAYAIRPESGWEKEASMWSRSEQLYLKQYRRGVRFDDPWEPYSPGKCDVSGRRQQSLALTAKYDSVTRNYVTYRVCVL